MGDMHSGAWEFRGTAPDVPGEGRYLCIVMSAFGAPLCTMASADGSWHAFVNGESRAWAPGDMLGGLMWVCVVRMPEGTFNGW